MQALQILKDRLQDSLHYDVGEDDLETLQHHAHALDRAFCRLLSVADQSSYDPFLHYALALRAQNQYRHTLYARKNLKEEAESEKT